MANYNAVNKRTLAEAIASDPNNSQEIAWMAEVILRAKNYCPIDAWFGGLGGGRPITEVMNFRKLAGQEIVAKRMAGLGGRGRQGDADRTGFEEKLKDKYFRAKVGAIWHGISQSRIASAMTSMGSEFDKRASTLLSEWLGIRRVMDVEAELFRAARIEKTSEGDALPASRNIIRPNSKGSENQLGSADVFGMNTITDVRDALLAINARALSISTGPNNQRIQKYLIQGTQYLFGDLNRNSSYQEIMTQAENRGPSQSIIAGGKPMWGGNILNEWLVESHDWDATQGARLIPIGYTGNAIPADPNTANGITILGGGSAIAGAKTDVDYWQNFHNAPYVGFEGTKIVADTTTERYLAVRARSGSNAGKWRLFAYTTNDGNKITITRSLSSSATGTSGSTTQTTLTAASVTDKATWNSGDWTTDYLTEAEIEIGAEVYQCNAKGQVLCYGYGIGSEMMLSGYGSLDGKAAFGRRTHEEQNHGKDVAIGMEAVWGCKANEDANGVRNGFVVIQAAYNPPGFPQIR